MEGGNTNNQWYEWERQGRIHTGDASGAACDWWRDAERDFDLARNLGLNALRLSLEWSRIEPRPGVWDGAAIQRYREMLGALRERGLRPMVTLHHFTNPMWFEERGAFLSPDAAQTFARFAGRAVEELGDLCDFWCTVNEPNVYAIVGYVLGDFPPGRTGDAVAAIRVMSTLARAHAAAYRAIHRIQPHALVGWAQNFNTFDPARPSSRLDRLAAGMQDAAFNDFFPRAVFAGGAAFPFSLVAGDLRQVRGTCDYVGINTYYRDLVRFDPRRASELFARRFAAPGALRSDQPMSQAWGEVYPQGIARIAARLAPFGKPLYVTESGVADHEDRLRPWVIARAVRAMSEAIRDGADLRGYFHWSLVDNFEWAEGYSMRFGLVALDSVTQTRTPRPSARLYSEIARANALTPAMLHAFGPDVVRAAFPDEVSD